ncbi:MAG: HEAT repeat domain-containing protein, partial [Planctomycetota bacterium]
MVAKNERAVGMNARQHNRDPAVPPPGPQNQAAPQPLVAQAARPVRRRLALLALVVGTLAIVVWLGLPERPPRIENQAGTTSATAAKRPSAPPKEMLPPPPPTPPGFIDLSDLQGEGLTVAEFVALIGKAAALPLKCEVLQTAGVALRISAYDGVLQVPVQDAQALLSYAGLAASQPQKDAPLDVYPISPTERMWQLLLRDCDPDGPDWGALRPWRSFKVSSTLKFEALISGAQRSPDAGMITALAWALPGASRMVAVGEDGRVTQEFSGAPSPAELQAAEKLFVTLGSGSADPAVRRATALGLGGLLGVSSQAQLPPDSPVVQALAALLKDQHTEVARAAALAAGHSASVATLSLLAERLLKSSDRLVDQAVALVALTQAESLGRHLDREALGAENWERRRALYQTVSSWLAAPQTQQAGLHEPALAAAWLRAREVFCPGAGLAEQAKALEESLWLSGSYQAQLVALWADRTGERLASPSLRPALQRAV